MFSSRRIRPLAALALAASAIGTLLVTAPTAQASWGNELQACKNAYGSEYYNGWEIPTVVLAKGSSRVCVRELQEELLEAGAVRSEDQPGFVDGKFGPKTYNAVVNFQRSGSTPGGPDGVVGRYTWHHLIATIYFE
ncbi:MULTISPECIES: peptidoglycan-binding domain-containing protein [unclassified Streptomyces]|uniref:peptidoglycan-binding domain-containing protein n=1 Tax=unclassified Streptomyces TaxID=2593676 RepID=UPI002E288C5C|nr:peptidoglycan-binding domain-containing protein [Streptomyces sp. NBC_00273]